MNPTIQVRFSAEEQRALAKLSRELGWSPSRIVREGLRLVAASRSAAGHRIAGLGQFASGEPDLGSNNKHLKGFGS